MESQLFIVKNFKLAQGCRLDGFQGLSLSDGTLSNSWCSYWTRQSTEMGYKVGLRLRELTPRGQKEPGGGIHAT